MSGLDRRRFLHALSVAPAAALLTRSGRAGGLLGRQPEEPLVPRDATAQAVNRPLLNWKAVGENVWIDDDPDSILGGRTTIVGGGRGETLVVDSKYPYVGEIILMDAQTLTGAEAAGITYVNTHHHGDHAGGNWAFRKVGRTLAHPKALERIREGADRMVLAAGGGPDLARRLGQDPLRIDVAVTAKRKLEDNFGTLEAQAEAFVPDPIDFGRAGELSEIRVGDLDVNLYHFGPGHTDNDVVVHIPERNVVVTGDLVFAKMTPQFDQDGGVTVFGWINALDRIIGLADDDTVVIPGYGQQVIELWDASLRQNTPRTGIEIVEWMRSFHVQMVDHCREGIAAGHDRRVFVTSRPGFTHGLGFGGLRTTAIGAVWDELGGPANRPLKPRSE